MKKVAISMMIASLLILIGCGTFLLYSYYTTPRIDDTIEVAPEPGEIVTRDYYIDIEQTPEDWDRRVKIHFFGTTRTEKEAPTCSKVSED